MEKIREANSGVRESRYTLNSPANLRPVKAAGLATKKWRIRQTEMPYFSGWRVATADEKGEYVMEMEFFFQVGKR
jgi:hypothetical protein